MTTTDDPVFGAVRASVVEVMPELDPEQIGIDGTLTALGLNSIDRVDVVTLSMDRLNVSVPVHEFGNVHDIRSLVELLRKYA